MRLLSALGYEDIEEYINYLPEVEVIDIAKDKRMLLDMINTAVYDLVLVSKELPGSEDIEHVIEVLVSNEINSHRIVFIYGEYDYFVMILSDS
jgi:chemotaxis response regulator CheB